MKVYITLRDLYSCEIYLLTGNTLWIDSGKHIPKQYHDNIIKELDMRYIRRNRSYVCDIEKVWRYFTSKFQNELQSKQIKSYDQLLYYMNIRK